MSEQLYREAAERVFNEILRRPEWDEATWQTMKAAHEAQGYTVARTAWDIGELVEKHGYTIEQILDHMRKERKRLGGDDPFRDRSTPTFV